MAENQESKMEPQTEETKDEEYKETSKASMVIWHSTFLGKFKIKIKCFNVLISENPDFTLRLIVPDFRKKYVKLQQFKLTSLKQKNVELKIQIETKKNVKSKKKINYRKKSRIGKKCQIKKK